METGQGSVGRVAIVGSGAIGCYVAGELARAGRDVTLCVRTPIERLRIVDKTGERDVSMPVVTNPDEVAPVRWLLVTTKAQDVPGAAGWLRALAGPETVTVVVQNGVDHEERVRPFLQDASPVLPAVIYCAVERTGPGRVVHHGGARIVVPNGPHANELAALFAGSAFEVEQDPEFKTVAWRKLLSNAIVNPITALTLRRMTVFRDERIQALARGLFAEVVAVAQAAGATLTDADCEKVLAGYASMKSGGSSMLYDRLAERPLEYEFISGAIVAAGERYGIPVPLNTVIMALAGAASGHPLDGSE